MIHLLCIPIISLQTVEKSNSFFITYYVRFTEDNIHKVLWKVPKIIMKTMWKLCIRNEWKLWNGGSIWYAWGIKCHLKSSLLFLTFNLMPKNGYWNLYLERCFPWAGRHHLDTFWSRRCWSYIPIYQQWNRSGHWPSNLICTISKWGVKYSGENYKL